MTNNCNAVIFDLDGTLWDATGCSCDIWNRVFDKYEEVGFRMTQEISAGLMGKTMEEIAQTVLAGYQGENARQVFKN